jgi:alkanesulfonate monooxygenase
MKVFWSLSTPARDRGAHPITHDLVQRTAEVAERLGYDGLVLPEGRLGADPWLVAASLARAARRICLVVGLRPGTTRPALAARMAATLDRLSEGRLSVEVLIRSGGVPHRCRPSDPEGR